MGFDFSLTSLIGANVFAFCVMVTLIVLMCKKFKVSEKLEANALRIKEIVDKSEADVLLSKENLEKSQASFDKLPAEILALDETAKNSGEILAKNVLQEAKNKTEIIQANTVRAIDYEVKNKKIALTKEVSGASLKLAYDNVNELLENNPNLHHEIINECINEL